MYYNQKKKWIFQRFLCIGANIAASVAGLGNLATYGKLQCKEFSLWI